MYLKLTLYVIYVWTLHRLEPPALRPPRTKLDFQFTATNKVDYDGTYVCDWAACAQAFFQIPHGNKFEPGT